jgi:hypothetical protein
MMRACDDSGLLELWESGNRRHPLDRALLTLAAALPAVPREGLGDWPLGRRNQALIEFHGLCFGPRLEGMVACAGCREQLEVALSTRDLVGGLPQPEEDPTQQTIEVNGEAFRLPNSKDLICLTREEDPHAAARLLAERCRVGSDGARDWDDGALETIGERMAAADPLAEIQVHLRCPQCGCEQDEVLDVEAFLWAEINARARRVLSDVHTLARAYGWSEADILSMSEARRALYLELAQS